MEHDSPVAAVASDEIAVQASWLELEGLRAFTEVKNLAP
jgi:hypothetical protein